jgi:hypothetical protein
VISAWGKSLSHKYNGNVGSTEENPATKCSLNSSDGSFSGIAVVAVRKNQLVLHIIGSEKVFQSGGCFVVKSLKFWFETLGSEFLMNVIICLDPFRGGPGSHSDNLYIIAVINITDHDV